MTNFFPMKDETKKKEIEKIELPINIHEALPLRPNLRWAMITLGYLIAAIVFCYVAFWIFAWSVLLIIDLEKEKKYLGPLFLDTSLEKLDMSRLQYRLPQSKDYDIYILEEEAENAFAMIGATLMITRWLLEAIQYEEELLFILGHEIEHLENRDALRWLLVHAPMTLGLAFLGFDSGIPISEIAQIFSNTQSRSLERSADAWGVELLHDLQLNTRCAIWFFERNQEDWEQYGVYFSTHPISSERIAFIEESAWEFWEKECTEFTLHTQRN